MILKGLTVGIYSFDFGRLTCFILLVKKEPLKRLFHFIAQEQVLYYFENT